MGVSQSDVLTGTAAGVHDQHGVQVFAVFLHGAAVALGGFMPEGVVLSDAVAPGRFEEVRKERWRFVVYYILQTRKRKRGKQMFGDEKPV